MEIERLTTLQKCQHEFGNTLPICSVDVKSLVGSNFDVRVFSMVHLFGNAVLRSAQEFLGEYCTIYNQLICLNDPRVRSNIGYHLGLALSPDNLDNTK